eukprot:IDg12815t1
MHTDTAKTYSATHYNVAHCAQTGLASGAPRYIRHWGERTLAASWREPGLHFRARKGIDNRAS